MHIDPSTAPPLAIYKLLIGCVVPRPIAWVSTVGPDGVYNLAPFSFFMAITNDPPTLAFSSGPRSADVGGARLPTVVEERPGFPGALPSAGGGGGHLGAPTSLVNKDTVVNVEATGEFVVNVVDDVLAEAMNLTSGEYPPDVDEFTLAGLASAPSVKVKPPRVADAPIAMECRLAQVIPVGRGPHSLVIGEVVHFYIRDDVYDSATGRVDLHRLKPVGRLAGEMYTHVHDIFTMKRPNPRYAG
ncbi:MAG: flavin reductase family protein [Candidatus Rokubacteria bacterium]|nr:flavin reductase family protein [Candidatus Rokubacteria bacterium]